MSQILSKITGKVAAHRLLITVCIILLSSLGLTAQTNTPLPTSTWTIEVKGMVTENDKKLPGSVITVYEGANAVSTVNSNDGKFDLTLEQDKDYTITFTKPGYITKRISFSTKNVTGERGKFGFTAFTIDEVDIFPEMEGTDIDKILQQPVAKIEYDSKYHNGDFNFDERYTESIQSILEKILAAKRALELQYKNLIKKADVEFSKQQYPLAKGDYLAALKLKPNEQYPKDQLAAIEKALADQKTKDDQNAKKLAAQGALVAKYDSAIKIADAAFAAKDYKNAKSAYTSASEVFPDKRYPKDQIRAIDRALSGEGDNAQKAAQQAKYDSLVKIADADFSSKKYDEAKEEYNNAIKVLPKNRYPRDQIALIDRTRNANQGNAKAAAEQAKYDSLVKIGDAAYNAKKYDDAKAAYKGAVEVKPAKPYPKQQLALIDKALAAKNASAQKVNQQKNAEAQFDSLVKLADAAFKTKDYTAAKTEYTNAQTLKPTRPYPRQQLAAIERILAVKPTKKPPVKKDSIVKNAPDTAKVVEAPAVAVTVCPCEIKKLTDSCRVRLKPFQYDGTNALHLPLLPVSQEKEISLPGFSGQRYRIIINISSMPPGTIVAIYDQDKTHKKRKLLYTLTDSGNRIGFLDSECKSGKFFIDYEIPAKDKKYPPQGCAVILFGFETRN